MGSRMCTYLGGLGRNGPPRYCAMQYLPMALASKFPITCAPSSVGWTLSICDVPFEGWADVDEDALGTAHAPGACVRGNRGRKAGPAADLFREPGRVVEDRVDLRRGRREETASGRAQVR